MGIKFKIYIKETMKPKYKVNDILIVGLNHIKFTITKLSKDQYIGYYSVLTTKKDLMVNLSMDLVDNDKDTKLSLKTKLKKL